MTAAQADNALATVEGSLLELGKTTTGRGMWSCPAHDDRTPSLSVSYSDDKVLLHCHAGCPSEAIVEALGLRMVDLWDTPRPALVTNPKKVADYQYLDRQGEHLSFKERWEPGFDGRPKSFRWSDGNPHVLYDLPAVVEADHVHIGEGEKAAIKLNTVLPAGHVATCAPTTAWEDSFTSILVGKTVSLWVDRDEAGKKQSAKTYAALAGAGISVTVVYSKTETPKDDAFDHIEAGFEVGQAVVMDPANLPVIGGAASATAFEDNDPSNPKSAFGGLPFKFFDEIDYHVRSRGMVKGVIDKGAFGVIFGPSGCSKTFLAIDISLCIASGRDWLGRQVSKHLVVYVAAEGGGSITNRIAAYRDQYLAGHENVLFALLPEPVSLLDEDAAVDRLVAAIKEIETKMAEQCGMVVIDTLSQSIEGGDENSPGTMTEAVGAVNRIRNEIGAAVVLIHHTGKDLSKGARGHSSLRAAADTELEVSPCGSGAFQVRPTKQRDYAMEEAIPYRLKVIEIGTDEDGEPQTTCVVESIDPEDVVIKRPRRGKLGARGEILKRCMEELFVAKRGTIPPDEVKNAHTNDFRAGQFALKVADLRSLFCKRLGDDPDMQDSPRDSLRAAFRRTIESVQAVGNVTVYEDYVWFTD